jgi:hypothetical protein
MQEITRKAITGLIWLQIIMAVMLFAPAWTLHFWEAWVFWLLFSVLGPSAEHEKSQKIIQTLTAALIIAPGIERRFNFSRIPAALVFLGDALVAVGYRCIRAVC